MGKRKPDTEVTLKEMLRRIRYLRKHYAAFDHLSLLERWLKGKWNPKRGDIADCEDCRKEAGL